MQKPLPVSSRIPGKTYMIIAFLTVGTMGLSNTSLGYLNYPTQVIFKCCKLIPVMIGGVFIQGQHFLNRLTHTVTVSRFINGALDLSKNDRNYGLQPKHCYLSPTDLLPIYHNQFYISFHCRVL